SCRSTSPRTWLDTSSVSSRSREHSKDTAARRRPRKQRRWLRLRHRAALRAERLREHRRRPRHRRRRQSRSGETSMEATATLKYLKASPQKVRLVADLIRGKKVDEALNILRFTRKSSAKDLEKLL